MYENLTGGQPTTNFSLEKNSLLISFVDIIPLLRPDIVHFPRPPAFNPYRFEKAKTGKSRRSERLVILPGFMDSTIVWILLRDPREILIHIVGEIWMYLFLKGLAT